MKGRWGLVGGWGGGREEESAFERENAWSVDSVGNLVYFSAEIRAVKNGNVFRRSADDVSFMPGIMYGNAMDGDAEYVRPILGVRTVA